MLVSGSITNPSLLVGDKANPSEAKISTSPITTRVEERSSKPDSSSKKNIQKTKDNLGVEEAVREYFADIPLMAEIAKCESRFRQYDTTGEVLRGKVNANDVGALQINETYHSKRAEKLGYDLETLQGNMAYARLLYIESGPQPWSASHPCWGKSPLAQNFKPKTRVVVTTTIPDVQPQTNNTVNTLDANIASAVNTGSATNMALTANTASAASAITMVSGSNIENGIQVSATNID